MQTKKKDKDWFRLKRYPHIGLPLDPSDRGWISRYVKDADKIATHSFFPFIHRETRTRKFRKEIAHDGSRSTYRKPTIKARPLYYANHLDSNIYSYYASILSTAYEHKLNALGINDCVTAYRRVKLIAGDPNSRNKSNVDFANDVFSYIKASKENELVAVTFDISSFFDNLDHKLLKKYWRFIIDDFSDDHYNVFRNITKFSYVNENKIFQHFKDEILVEREPDLVVKKKVKRKIHLRNKRAIAFCDKTQISEIRDNNLIKSNKYSFDCKLCSKKVLRTKGIPQGSPISAVLANVYMLEFDQEANEFLSKLGGIYRRYSDDMVVICSAEHKEAIITFFLSKIKDYKLEIQQSKTQIFEFKYSQRLRQYTCLEYNQNTKKLQSNTKFEYLGFQFDGKTTLLKNSSISGYYRKMKRSIKHGRFHAVHNNTQTQYKVFKSRLYKRHTHVGATRRRIFQRDPNNKSKFILTHKFDWGNYLTYAKLAARTIKDNKINGQLRNHWNKFHVLLNAPLRKRTK